MNINGILAFVIGLLGVICLGFGVAVLVGEATTPVHWLVLFVVGACLIVLAMFTWQRGSL